MILYEELAQYWTLVSPVSEYKEAAGFWMKSIQKRCKKERPSALELGVGGGNSLHHLTDILDAWAVDLSPQMIENSKKINPGVQHFVGDMRTVRLGRKFELLMVHDAVMYMKSEKDLLELFETARIHLESGGLLLMSPDHFKDSYKDNQLACVQNGTGDGVLSFSELNSDLDPSDTFFECHFTISVRTGCKISHYHETHELGLFWKDDWKRLLEMSGFEYEFDDYVEISENEPGFLVAGTLK